MVDKKENYEKPVVEVVEFAISESITMSGEGAAYFEEYGE